MITRAVYILMVVAAVTEAALIVGAVVAWLKGARREWSSLGVRATLSAACLLAGAGTAASNETSRELGKTSRELAYYAALEGAVIAASGSLGVFLITSIVAWAAR